MITMSLPSATGPALVMSGFHRPAPEERPGFWTRATTAVNLVRENDDWWLIIYMDDDIVTESKVDGITQTLRILWAYGLVTWDWAEKKFEPKADDEAA